jgi:hypothetical protein
MQRIQQRWQWHGRFDRAGRQLVWELVFIERGWWLVEQLWRIQLQL